MRQTVTVLVVAVLAFGIVAPVAAADAPRAQQEQAEGPTVRNLQIENLTTTFTVDSMELGSATIDGQSVENVTVSNAQVTVTNASVSVVNGSLSTEGDATVVNVENGSVSVEEATVTVESASGTLNGQEFSVEDRTFTVQNRTMNFQDRSFRLGSAVERATISQLTITGLNGNLSLDRAQLTRFSVGENTMNVTLQNVDTQFSGATLSVENATIENGELTGEQVTLTVDDGYAEAEFAFFMVDESFIGFENDRVPLDETTITVEDGSITLQGLKGLIP